MTPKRYVSGTPLAGFYHDKLVPIRSFSGYWIGPHGQILSGSRYGKLIVKKIHNKRKGERPRFVTLSGDDGKKRRRHYGRLLLEHLSPLEIAKRCPRVILNAHFPDILYRIDPSEFRKPKTQNGSIPISEKFTEAEFLEVEKNLVSNLNSADSCGEELLGELF